MHMTREEACERLELTKTQQSRIFQHQVHRERQEALEDSRIMSMHAEQMALLLDGNSKSLGRVTPEIFRTSIEKYLYNDLGDTYHRTVSERELIDGQIFLKALGLDPDLSTEWFDLPDDEDSCKFHFGRQLAQISSNSSDISKLST